MSEGGMCCGRGAALISNIGLSMGRREMMRAPISPNLVPELRRVASQYIALPERYILHFQYITPPLPT